MKRLLHLIIIIALITPCRLSAQTIGRDQQLEMAEMDYHIGKFEEALALLSANLNAYQGTEKQKALRLMSLCYLAQDDDKQAEDYARQLLNLNHYYSSVDDPVRFEEMVNRIKAGMSIKVSTASSVSEDINESPVPMTIITAEMIENLGNNKNLNQILATFVPGMAEIQGETTDNLSMHGAYANNQELILVMENGHRLNARSTNAYSMNYSISTEKIDHIEVLRGPASSLYGNVALSAVVNIITKSGIETDAVKVKYGYGSFGTHKADLTVGTRFLDSDVFAWASIYKSDGEERTVLDSAKYEKIFYVAPAPGQYAHVGAYKDKPSFDIGFTLRRKGLDLSFSRKRSKKVNQFGDFGYYDYDRYRLHNGMKPGYTVESTHAEVGYLLHFGSFNVSASAYGDWYNINNYQVYGEENPENELLPETERNPLYGMFNIDYSSEHTLGGNLRAFTDYHLGPMTGNLLVGAQYEHFTMDDMTTYFGNNYVDINSVSASNRFNAETRENSLSFYAQDKHHLTRQLILNAGVRYDIKHRNNKNVTAWSPRLALIWLPSNNLSMRMTYSKSFVDMPYNTRVFGYLDDDEGYLPQYLTAVQYSVIGKFPSWHIFYDVNLFYNKFENLLYRFFFSTKKWRNEGRYDNWGVEASASYLHKRWAATMTFYWCNVIKVESYYYDEEKNRVSAVPNITVNMNIAYKFLQHKKHELKARVNAHLTGSKLLQEHDLDPATYTSFTVSSKLDERMQFDAGINYAYDKWLKLSLDCENIFNTNQFLAGPQYNMFPQFDRSRTIMGTIAFTF